MLLGTHIIFLSVCLSVCLSIDLSIQGIYIAQIRSPGSCIDSVLIPSICLSVCLSVCLSIYLSIYLPIYLGDLYSSDKVPRVLSRFSHVLRVYREYFPPISHGCQHLIIVISKLLKRNSKAKGRAPAYSWALHQIRWILRLHLPYFGLP